MLSDRSGPEFVGDDVLGISPGSNENMDLNGVMPDGDDIGSVDSFDLSDEE